MRTASLLLVMLIAAPAAIAADAVTVRKEPASIMMRTFDPKHPPRDMPKLRPNEAAVTESAFSCQVQVEVETRTAEDEAPKTKIVGLAALLKLEVTEWLPKNCPAKTRVHEDGHRVISELYYQNVETVASEIAKRYIGKELKIKSTSSSDIQQAIQQAANEYCQEYLGAVQVPSEKAQQLYDKITDHGRNKVPEKQAVKRAVEQAGKPAATQASGK